MERHLTRQAVDPSEAGAGCIGLYGHQVASLDVLPECVASKVDDMEHQWLLLCTPSQTLELGNPSTVTAKMLAVIHLPISSFFF